MKNDDIAERKKKSSLLNVYICIKYKRMMEKIL